MLLATMLNFKNGMKITSNVNDDLSGIFGSHILLILMVSRIKDKMQSLMMKTDEKGGQYLLTCLYNGQAELITYQVKRGRKTVKLFENILSVKPLVKYFD